MRSFLRDRTLHQGWQNNQRKCENSGEPKYIEISQCSGLLLAEISQRLPGHEVARSRIARCLKKQSMGLIDEGSDRRVERIEELADARRVELLAADFHCLGQACSNTASFVPQQARQSDRRAAK